MTQKNPRAITIRIDRKVADKIVRAAKTERRSLNFIVNEILAHWASRQSNEREAS